MSDEFREETNATPSPDETALTAPPSTLHTIFQGPEGLRSGWSILIFLLLFTAFVAGASFLNHMLHPHARRTIVNGVISPRYAFYSEFVPFLGVLFSTWILSKIERRRMGVYGFADHRRMPHFLSGLFWGAAILSLVVFILIKAGLLIIDSRLLFGGDAWKYGAIWFVCFLFVALFEETLTRGYLQYTLTRGFAGIYKTIFALRHSAALGFWTAALLLSFLFGLVHHTNPGESPIGLISAGLVAMVFCLSLWRTGSLWWAIGAHASWDWAQSFLYGVADSGTIAEHRLFATHPVGRPLLSGGTTGPEGSLFVLVGLALLLLIIIFTLRPTDGYIAHLPLRLRERPESQPNGIV